jgi:hypothetical protein
MGEVSMTLEDIAARLEIADVLHRYCRGVDRGDMALLKSVYHPDARDDHGSFKGSGHAFAEYLVPNMDAVPHVGQHHITNILIFLDGDVAAVESYFLAFHPQCDAQTGAPTHVHVGGRYLDRFERRDGAWKIARREVVIDFGNAPMVSAEWEAKALFAGGGRRERDPSHAMFGPVGGR